LEPLGWDSRVLSRRDVHRWDARSLIALLRATPREGVVHIQYQAGAFDLLGDVCVMPMLLRQFRPRIRVVTTFHDVRVAYLFPPAVSSTPVRGSTSCSTRCPLWLPGAPMFVCSCWAARSAPAIQPIGSPPPVFGGDWTIGQSRPAGSKLPRCPRTCWPPISRC